MLPHKIKQVPQLVLPKQYLPRHQSQKAPVELDPYIHPKQRRRSHQRTWTQWTHRQTSTPVTCLKPCETIPLEETHNKKTFSSNNSRKQLKIVHNSKPRVIFIRTIWYKQCSLCITWRWLLNQISKLLLRKVLSYLPHHSERLLYLTWMRPWYTAWMISTTYHTTCR